MARLSGSVEADVPITFADKEWTEFTFRSYGSYAREFADVATSLAEIDADAGTVTFETEGARLVRVSVEVEYTPRGRDEGADVARAQGQLERTSRSSASSCCVAANRRAAAPRSRRAPPRSLRGLVHEPELCEQAELIVVGVVGDDASAAHLRHVGEAQIHPGPRRCDVAVRRGQRSRVGAQKRPSTMTAPPTS